MTLKDLDDPMLVAFTNLAGIPLRPKASPKEKKKALYDAVNLLRNTNPFPGSVDDPTAKQLAKFTASGVLGHFLLQKREKKFTMLL
jgi:hypothetical protein